MTVIKRFKLNAKKYLKTTDKLLWLFSLLATGYSLALIYSVQTATGVNYLRSQLFAAAIGIVGAVVLSAVNYRAIIKFWYIAGAVGIILGGAVFLFGITVSGTDDTAWLQLPGGISVQPSELIKLCFIVTFSKHLSRLSEKNKLRSLRGVGTLVIHAMIPIVIIHIQGDDGSALIFFIMFLVMSFTAGVQLRYFVAMGSLMLAGLPIFWSFVMNDEHRNRIIALFAPDGKALGGYGWQQYQGKLSIASGGLSGSGFRHGLRVQTGIVPEQQNDFIFTVAGEELGFVGCMAIFLILILLMIKIFLTAYRSPDCAGRSVCFGFFAMLSSQSIINLGMVMGFLPVIGITLPFFSQGGSSIMSMFWGIGLVQSVYMHRRQQLRFSGEYLNRAE